MSIPEHSNDPGSCGCGHAWAQHNEFGCFAKEGHASCDDAYCMCPCKPPSIVERERQERLKRVLLYPCAQHPRYQVKRKPRVPCEACWRMWIEVQG